MLRNENIICISSIDWDFIWQGHQEIMSTLSRNGNRVLFIENTGVRAPGLKDIPRLKKRIKDYFRGVKGIRKEHDNLYVFSPIVLPFPYSWIARKINKYLFLSVLEKWVRVIDFADPIVWTFLPTGIALDIIENINKKLLIYYCIDNFFVSSFSAKKIRLTERKLLKIADLVFVTSQALYNYCSVYNDNVSLFPFGVNLENFEKIRLSSTEIPSELKNIKKPIVGYVGGIHKWIDQELVKNIALRLPDFSFVFVGPLQTDVSMLSEIKNIHFLGNKPHQELPNIIKYFSATIIPYLITDYTKNVYPTKLNEYLAIGKPVISTDLPEIDGFNQKYQGIVYIAKTAEDFCSLINKTMKEDNDLLRNRRIEVAADNSWQRRIEQMSNLIEKAIIEKLLDREARWRESFLVFYRRARRRFIRLSLIVILVYGIIFYTPFIWFLAEPLKIQDIPQKTDAIVVFAGGVGESGKPGQGYEERVQYAVELYEQKYAENLIFSSGYMHVYKEPLIMKALAVSLGIPENAIFLECEAKNTYENVKFSKGILERNGWNKIILVSSPYHMRRAYLVFRKVAKEIKVSYTPLPRSPFYLHENRNTQGRRIWQRVNLEQIKALLHEYLGILYYWYKGWV